MFAAVFYRQKDGSYRNTQQGIFFREILMARKTALYG